MTRDIQTQYSVELPEAWEPLMAAHGDQITSAFVMALNLLFGLPAEAPTQLRANFTGRYQLVEVSGLTLREASPAEIQGCFVGVQATLLCVLFAHPTLIHLNKERVTDA